MTDELARVFVYGTLMRGEFLHGSMQHADARYLGAALVLDYTLVLPRMSATFPAIVQQRGCYVVGEMYEMPPRGLLVLDEVEGVSRGYYERATLERAHVFNAEGSGYVTSATVYRLRYPPVNGFQLGPSWRAASATVLQGTHLRPAPLGGQG